MEPTKMETELGWKPEYTFDIGIPLPLTSISTIRSDESTSPPVSMRTISRRCMFRARTLLIDE